MAIKIKSNFDQFMKRMQAIPRNIEIFSKEVVENVLKRMCEDMKRELTLASDLWKDNGGLETIYNTNGGTDVEYELSGSGKSGTIYVGRNTSKILVGKDDKQNAVNPYLFIQFGFGLAGQEKPVEYAVQRGWQYNINNHTEAWWYWGLNGQKQYTTGQVGYDFFYSVLRKYRKEWKRIAEEALLEQNRLLGV